jgi:hypothetical protein
MASVDSLAGQAEEYRIDPNGTLIMVRRRRPCPLSTAHAAAHSPDLFLSFFCDLTDGGTYTKEAFVAEYGEFRLIDA